MVTREEYLKALQVIREYKQQLENEIEEVDATVKEVLSKGNIPAKDAPLEDVGMSTRLFNVFRTSGIFENVKTLADLENMSLYEIMRARGMGSKALKELKEICYAAGIKLQY